jgi:hypothetical protein
MYPSLLAENLCPQNPILWFNSLWFVLILIQMGLDSMAFTSILEPVGLEVTFSLAVRTGSCQEYSVVPIKPVLLLEKSL